MKRLAVSLALCAFICAAAGFAAPLAPNTAVVLVNGAPLYEETNKVLKALEYLTLGDIVKLLNQTATFTEAKAARDFIRVRSSGGNEGWVRTQYLAAKASLAIVKADQAVIYTEPRDVKVTGNVITGMTLVAVLQEGSTPTFAKVQGYDASQNRIFTDATFVGVNDLTTSEVDVNAGILYNVAMATKDGAVKKNLLRVALKKYGGSIFKAKIQIELDAMP